MTTTTISRIWWRARISRAKWSKVRGWSGRRREEERRGTTTGIPSRKKKIKNNITSFLPMNTCLWGRGKKREEKRNEPIPSKTRNLGRKQIEKTDNSPLPFFLPIFFPFPFISKPGIAIFLFLLPLQDFLPRTSQPLHSPLFLAGCV